MSQSLATLSASSAKRGTSEPVQPPPKRFKTAASTNETPHEENVEQTVLALHDLPLDIIMEILSHATPEALLVLSRATKFLRSTLMSRSAISVWRGSLASVNCLPPKPDDMTEPQYVDLIWGTGCSFCLDTKTVVSSFVTRRRYCEKCYTECDMPCHLEDWVGVRTLFDIIPSVRLGSEYGHNERHFDRAIADQYETEVITMWGSNDSSRLVDLPKWISDKKSAHAAVRQHAWLLESCIVQRLTDIGWGYELSRLPANSLGRQNLVRAIWPLVEDEWVQMKDDLVQFLVDSRERRLVRDKQMARIQRQKLLIQVYPRFLCRKPLNALMPPADEICLTDEFRRVSESVPDDRELSADALMKALETTPEAFFDQWRAQAEDELVALVQDRLRKDPTFKTFLGLDTITRGTLKLATIQLTNLVGNTFGHSYSYPTIFHYFEVAFFNAERLHRRWDDRCLYIGSGYTTGALIVKRMVELALKDPASTTADEMDNLDPWDYFGGEEQNGERTAYAWRCVLNDVRNHREPRMGSLAILNAEDTARAQSTDLRAHMRKKHDIKHMTRKDFQLGLSVKDAPHMTVSIHCVSG
ncbi:hypothetical protein EV122DRAFT_278898 [Schizophyllum commune]